MKPILIAGIGNMLLGDDGVGPALVYDYAHRFEPEDDVDIEDLGTPGLELASDLAFREAVILVDAMHSALDPGAIRIFSKDQILARTMGHRIGSHTASLADALESLELAGIAPHFVALICIAGQNWELGVPISSAVRIAMPDAMEAVYASLRIARQMLSAHGM
jgi:hydrogenase maturation protease